MKNVFPKVRSKVLMPAKAASSYFAMKIALRHALTQEAEHWPEDFTGKRVLIAGTGPSLDHVTDDYFKTFDTVICINHAVLSTPAHARKYYVSTDVPRTWDVMNADTNGRIEALPHNRKVLFLSFILMKSYLTAKFFEKFSVVRYQSYHFHKRGGHF